MWLIVHARRRDMLSGATCGTPEFTTDPLHALRFDTTDKARRWLELHIVSAFGELVLTRSPGAADDSTRKGVPGHNRPRANP